MKYTCIACSESTMGLFLGKEKALFYLLEMSTRQKEVFLYSFISYEIIERCLKYYSSSYLEIYGNTLYYQDNYMIINENYIETNNISTNILFGYMKGKHRIWCCKDEDNHIIWINTCKLI
ncbi:MAG: hypothetical protein ACI4U3_08730 [Traorella sp.]